MFLVGGPAFSGTTLLSLMLNQGDIVCLDEPDFHSPAQLHRSIKLLRARFPHLPFKEHPGHLITFAEATGLAEDCERLLQPLQLGIKTCNSYFLGYYRIYRRRGWPVIAIFRDIRDALVRPLPDGFTESGLNDHYRLIWRDRSMFDLWLRYEDLVADPGAAMSRISSVLGRELSTKSSWERSEVTPHLLKLDKHELLKTLQVSTSRVGIWRTSVKSFSEQSHETARMMGY
jgi:hypothetical protein